MSFDILFLQSKVSDDGSSFIKPRIQENRNKKKKHVIKWPPNLEK